MLHFIKGNLFDRSNNVDAIINTVNCFGVMGKGIALEFKNRYPNNFIVYKQACNNKQLIPGKMLTVYNQDQSYPKYIINFPTKNHWRHPSKIEYIENGLTDLVRDIEKYSIKSVAMPALGCGNGGLNWQDVKTIIENSLSPLEHVDFYIYEPSNIKPKQVQETKLNNIRLTKQRKLIMLLMDHFNTSSFKESITYLEVNYLAYLAQFCGSDLKLNFKLTDIGPTDTNINKLLLMLATHDYLFTQSDEESKNSIHLNKKKFKPKTALKDDELSNEFAKVIELINGFETKERLKTLTLAVWFFSNDVIIEDIPSSIQKWAAVNKEEISEFQIREAINRVMSFTSPNVENLTFDI